MEESIFEHNVTLEELNYLQINLAKEEYKRCSSITKKYYHLFMLFKLRNNNSKAEEVLNKLSLKLINQC